MAFVLWKDLLSQRVQLCQEAIDRDLAGVQRSRVGSGHGQPTCSCDPLLSDASGPGLRGGGSPLGTGGAWLSRG